MVAQLPGAFTGAALRLAVNAMVDYRNLFSIPDLSLKGVTDDDSALVQAAIDTGLRVFLPRTATPWIVQNLTNTGSIFIVGESSPRYFSSAPTLSDMANQSALQLKSGGTALFSTPGRVTLENLWCRGGGTASDAADMFVSSIGAKIPDLRAFRCNIHNFRVGFGENQHYAGTSLVEECNVSWNRQGVAGLVDSKVKGGFFNGNQGHGIYFGSGCNDNVVEGPKAEWNQGHGLFLYGARRCAASLMVIDRNAQSGIRVESVSSSQPGELTISASVSRRNGRNGTGQNIYLRNPGVFLGNGIITQHGFSDDGGGSDTPATGLQIDYTDGGVPAGSITRIRDCDLRGYSGGALAITGDSYLTAASGSLKIADCPGVADTAV